MQQDYQQPHEFPSKKMKLADKPPLLFNIIAQRKSARASLMQLPHGIVFTPVFMPVGTKGTIKGLTSEQLQTLGCRILLANTYHIAYQPGVELLEKVGGLHKYMNWKGNMLTDSGGFQMVSLSKLCEVNEEGVKFLSPVDGSEMFLRPQDSIHIQNVIGSDIMMVLDDVVKTTTVGQRMQQAMLRTIRWIDRNIAANANPDTQNIFPILQGGIDLELRLRCINELTKRQTHGYAIGGLAGGESKSDFVKVVKFCCDRLPKEKPRYLMGVGYPADLVLCVLLGVDMFDCVFPTRTARFGSLFTEQGQINIKNHQYRNDFRPISEGCQCQTCREYTRAYLHAIHKMQIACHLFTIHNLHYQLNLMTTLRQSIIDDRVEEFARSFYEGIYKKEGKLPDWVIEGLELANVDHNNFFT